MDWSDEYKLCYIGHCRLDNVLWDTWYIDYKKRVKQRCVDSARAEIE
jgi:hypothetical protein